MLPNHNPTTGIPYGVTSRVPSWLWDEIDSQWETDNWPEIQAEIAYEVLKNNRHELTAEMWTDAGLDLDDFQDLAGLEDDQVAELVEEWFPRQWEWAMDSFDGSEHRKSGVVIDEKTNEPIELSLSYLGGAPLLWVIRSPVLVRARPTSPCVPGAIDLDSIDPDGVEGYGLPADWYGVEDI